MLIGGHFTTSFLPTGVDGCFEIRLTVRAVGRIHFWESGLRTSPKLKERKTWGLPLRNTEGPRTIKPQASCASVGWCSDVPGDRAGRFGLGGLIQLWVTARNLSSVERSRRSGDTRNWVLVLHAHPVVWDGVMPAPGLYVVARRNVNDLSDPARRYQRGKLPRTYVRP